MESSSLWLGIDVKESACNAGDSGLIPGLGMIPSTKRMATHSSILAWRTLWTEESAELQSMGSQTVRHDWAHNRGSIKKKMFTKQTRKDSYIWLLTLCF